MVRHLINLVIPIIAAALFYFIALQLNIQPGYINYAVFLIVSIALFAMFSLGLNLQWGFTGLINFGHVAFLTLGTYTTVLLSLLAVPLWLAVLAGTLLAAFLGLLLGMSTLRLREDYLAIVTIGTSEVIRLIALNEEWLTKGAFGVNRYPLPFADLEPNSWQKLLMTAILGGLAVWGITRVIKYLRKGWQSQKLRGKIGVAIGSMIALALILLVYGIGIKAIANYTYKAGLMLLILVCLALVYWGLEFLVQSPWGRVLKAIREDEEVPRALGKNVFWYKLQALMLGGAIAGFAGAFYAWQYTTVYPNNFEPIITFNAWTIVMLGGAGNNTGTILGAIIFWLVFEPLTRYVLPKLGLFNETQIDPLRLMIIGLILILLMIWRPQGILGKKAELTLNR